MLPLLTLAGSWLVPKVHSWDALTHLATTVLPVYIINSLALAIGVALGTLFLGVAAALLVSVVEFKGRRILEWLLVLPMAVPAYVLAYAYTDFFQYSGPFQHWLRVVLAKDGAMLPEIRSLGGAILIFSFALYPYVYLLTRTALQEQSPSVTETARLLGAGWLRRIGRITLPMAWPAITVGLVLVLMEVLADYGVVSYFALPTFTSGIYKAWLILDDPLLASQLASALVCFVFLLIFIEHYSRRKLRVISTRSMDRKPSPSHQIKGLPVLGVWVLGILPVLFGFFLPLGFMLRTLMQEGTVLPWSRFMGWSMHSLQFGISAALLATALGLFLTYRQRLYPSMLQQSTNQLIILGYALPGSIVVIGLMLPVIQLNQFSSLGVGYWMTTTSLGLLWAYLIRFTSVALQTVDAGYSRIAPSLDDASRALGVEGWTLFQKVHFPLLRRTLGTGILLVFVDVVKELPVTLILRPFDRDTLAVATYNLALDERLGEAALPALMLVFVGLLPVLLLNRTLKDPFDKV